MTPHPPSFPDSFNMADTFVFSNIEAGRGEKVAIHFEGRGLVRPEEVAAAVLWLASEEAAAVNGIALPVAGGEVA